MEGLNTLYIPDYVLPGDIPLIKENFEKLNLGKVNNIKLTMQPECEYHVDRDIYSAALVYIEYWNDSEEAKNFKDMISDENSVAKIVYNDVGDYWEFEMPTFNQDNEDNQESKENQDNEIKNLKEKLSFLVDRINDVDYYMNYNTNGIQYLLELDRVNNIKKMRAEKRNKIYKKNMQAKIRWQKRLRPRNSV